MSLLRNVQEFVILSIYLAWQSMGFRTEWNTRFQLRLSKSISQQMIEEIIRDTYKIDHELRSYAYQIL